MRKILTYIGLHFRLQFGRDKTADKKSIATTIVMGIAACVVILFLAKYLFDIIAKQFGGAMSSREISVVVVTVIEVVLIVLGISLEIKFFLKPEDLKISARFPMSSLSLFVAQLLIVYIYLLIISVVGLLPIMLIFGWSTGVLSGAFVGWLVLAIFFAPMIPFSIATILVVPTMLILTLLDNQNVIKLLLFLVVIAGLFVLYSIFLNFLAEYYVHQRVDSSMQNGIISLVSSMNNGWNFFLYLNNILFGTEVLKSIGIILSIFVVLLGAGIGISIPAYSRVRENVLEGKRGVFSKKSNLSHDNAFWAIFKKEFKQIIRTHTYAYFYLGIAITTPVMVFLTNSILQKIGEAQIGSSVAFGVSILVVLAFMSMINAFSASSISREGREFYITKIVPVSPRTQLLSKGLLNAVVSFGALLVSVIILCSMKFITVVEGLVVFVVGLSMALGIIFNGFNINLRHPNLTASDGEGSQANGTLTMFLGFLLSAVVGVISIVMIFLVEMKYIYLIIMFLTIIYAAINFVVFFLTANKKYSQIEFR